MGWPPDPYDLYPAIPQPPRGDNGANRVNPHKNDKESMKTNGDVKRQRLFDEDTLNAYSDAVGMRHHGYFEEDRENKDMKLTAVLDSRLLDLVKKSMEMKILVQRFKNFLHTSFSVNIEFQPTLPLGELDARNNSKPGSNSSVKKRVEVITQRRLVSATFWKRNVKNARDSITSNDVMNSEFGKLLHSCDRIYSPSQAWLLYVVGYATNKVIPNYVPETFKLIFGDELIQDLNTYCSIQKYECQSLYLTDFYITHEISQKDIDNMQAELKEKFGFQGTDNKQYYEVIRRILMKEVLFGDSGSGKKEIERILHSVNSDTSEDENIDENDLLTHVKKRADQIIQKNGFTFQKKALISNILKTYPLSIRQVDDSISFLNGTNTSPTLEDYKFTKVQNNTWQNLLGLIIMISSIKFLLEQVFKKILHRNELKKLEQDLAKTTEMVEQISLLEEFRRKPNQNRSELAEETTSRDGTPTQINVPHESLIPKPAQTQQDRSKSTEKTTSLNDTEQDSIKGGETIPDANKWLFFQNTQLQQPNRIEDNRDKPIVSQHLSRQETPTIEESETTQFQRIEEANVEVWRIIEKLREIIELKKFEEELKEKCKSKLNLYEMIYQFDQV